MRRFLFGVVIASVTAAMPAWACGGDREIAQTVMAELQQHKAAGNLKGFDIDLKVEDGVVYLTGEVATRAQRAIVEQAAINEVGRVNLVNELRVKGDEPEALPMPTQKAGTAVKKAAKPTESAVVLAEPQVLPVSSSKKAEIPGSTDAAVTDSVIDQLQQSKAAGTLRGFDLDVSTVNGDVWIKGTVANQSQKDIVIDIVRRTRGVSRVVDDVLVANSSPVRQVSTGAPMPVPQGSSMPIQGQVQGQGQVQVVPMAPQAFAPSGLAGYTQNVDYAGGPVPMQGAGGEYGAGAPRYDQPNMPSYAWPSYAAHPNYAAVTYPKQYSPSAWPYIGPFYPYPQVPLGWRKVALEWDDGLWYLDFTSK